MESSRKTKRNQNDDDENDSDEADIKKFSEIVEKFRVPYDWYQAKMSGSSLSDFPRTVLNCSDRGKRKKKKVEDESSKRSDGVWMPCFLVEDFIEDASLAKFEKPAMKRSDQTAAAAKVESQTDSGMIQGGSEEKKELDLNLSL